MELSGRADRLARQRARGGARTGSRTEPASAVERGVADASLWLGTRSERHERGVPYALELDGAVGCARCEGGSNDHAVADDERGHGPCFDLAQHLGDAMLLLEEALAAGEGEFGIGGGKSFEQR